MKTFKQFNEEVSQTAVVGQDGSNSIIALPVKNIKVSTKNKIATSSTSKVNTLGNMTGGPYFGSAFS